MGKANAQAALDDGAGWPQRMGSSMLSPDERKLIAGILALLLLGTLVRTCRSRSTVESMPKVELPSVEVVEPPTASPD